MSQPVYRFGTRPTPKGVTAWVITPRGYRQEKRFLNGCYSSASIQADRWIESQIQTIRDYEEEMGRPPAIIEKEAF